MKITIEYEASWRNAFLAGSNNEPLPKEGRQFIGSMTKLKTAANFIQREVTLDTVMGILNRLIGDQRKLYQSRQCHQYFFKEIEPLVSFHDKPTVINNEMIYIRNTTGSTDQESFAGMIKGDDPIFTAEYAPLLWGVLGLALPELLRFILGQAVSFKPMAIEPEPLAIAARLKEIGALKAITKEGEVEKADEILTEKFEKYNALDNKGNIKPLALYCSALYIQLAKLSQQYDMTSAITKTGRISGISNNGFTKKDFMARYTTGGKKKIWGNPYIREEFVKGEGKTQRLMTKASGVLEININITRDKAKALANLIDNAGVSSFYLGKKGLAYVKKIRT